MPISDLLHLLKCIRRRLHDWALNPGKPGLKGAGGMVLNAVALGELSDFVAIIDDGSQHTGFQDVPALELCRLTTLVECITRGMHEAARYLAPFSLIEAAIREVGVSRRVRCQLLQMAFTLLNRARLAIGEDFWLRDQILRAMNLCVMMFFVLVHFRAMRIAMGRLGSHALECHFGLVRSMLRGDDRFEMWMAAEVRAMLLTQFLASLEVPSVSRRTRVPISGAQVPALEEEDIEVTFEGIEGLSGEVTFTHDFDRDLDWCVAAAREFGEVVDSFDNDFSRMVLELEAHLEGCGIREPLRPQGSRAGVAHVTRFMQRPVGLIDLASESTTEDESGD